MIAVNSNELWWRMPATSNVLPCIFVEESTGTALEKRQIDLRRAVLPTCRFAATSLVRQQA